MELDPDKKYLERSSGIVFQPPTIESLLSEEQARQTWPEQLTNHPDFIRQIQERQALRETINIIFDQLPRPDLDWQTAVEQATLAETVVEHAYIQLSQLLETESKYRRLILYLPFESLPAKTWQPNSPGLKQASIRFRTAFMATWHRLLSVHDVRANFVDGDVLEVDQRTGDLPRVVKAAHLIPKLVEKGLLTIDEVLALLNDAKNEVLKNSITEALLVIGDLGLASKEKLGEINESPAAKTPEPENISDKRRAWLAKKNNEEQRLAEATILSQKIQTGEDLDLAATDQLTNIEAIRLAIEATIHKSRSLAKTLYRKNEAYLLKLCETSSLETKTLLTKLFHHLHQIDLIESEQLTGLGIQSPHLAGPFSKNLEAMPAELAAVRSAVSTIETDPELSKLIYPAALLFGSRLKGHGDQDADLDLAVFVRPGTDFAQRTKLQALLKQTFTHEKFGKEIVEFWLEEKADKLVVKNFPENDVTLGESFWTHVLLGAAWEGQPTVIKELHHKLLAPYFLADQPAIEIMGDLYLGEGLYLGELERDCLQYRLMHKGYEKFYPPYGGIHTAHSNQIDGASVFWDSGYRQLATRLFLNRVFLPEVK